MFVPVFVSAVLWLITAVATFEDINKIPETRITNGNKASINQFPFQVGIKSKKISGIEFCGGSIISEEYVLTAAHCTKNARYVRVYMGSLLLLSGTSYCILASGSIFIHPEYNFDTDANDIALIKTPRITFSDSIQPVLLPDISLEYETYAGKAVLAAGWGCLKDTSTNQLSQYLMYTQVIVMTNVDCGKFFSPILESNLCVSTSNQKSPSDGDSGGAIILKDSNTKNPTQIGVQSFGYELGSEKGYPVVYTRITSYLQWIRDTQKGNANANYVTNLSK